MTRPTSHFTSTLPGHAAIAALALLNPLHRNLHLPRLGRFLLRQRNRQHTILVIGGNFVGFYCRRHRKAAHEFPIAAFDPVITLHLLIALELPRLAHETGNRVLK